MSFYPGSTRAYTVLHRGLPTFRIRIPSDLQACLGRTEYRRSLGRCYAQDAKLRALRLATASFEVFLLARNILKLRVSELKLTKEEENRFGGSTIQPFNRSELSMISDVSGFQYGYTNRLHGRSLASLTDEEIRSIAQDWLLQALKGTSNLALHLSPLRLDSFRSGSDLDFHSTADAATAGNIKKLYQDDLKARRMERIADKTDTELDRRGVTRDPSTESRCALDQTPPAPSLAYLKSCMEMLKAQVTYYGFMEDSAKGEYAAFDREVEQLEERLKSRQALTPHTGPVIPVVNDAPATSTLTIRAAIKDYIADRIREKIWSDHSQVKQRDKFVLFGDILDPDGTVPLASLGADHMRLYKAVMFGLPANRSKNKKYRDMPFADLMEAAREGDIPESERIKPGTLRNHFQQIKAFVNWAAQNEYLGNPKIVGLLTVKMDKQAHESRSAYTREELSALFNPDRLLPACLPRGEGQPAPHRFWLPLLGLFSGARLEELAQLHTEDVVVRYQSTGENRPFVKLSADQQAAAVSNHGQETLLCLNIHKGKPYQTIKNLASTRLVPLSDALVHGLNFPAYVLTMHRLGQRSTEPDAGRLFPELQKPTAASRYSNIASRWFGRYREKLGLTGLDALKDFHSFRDTVAEWCDRNNVQEKASSRCVGHAEDSMTYGRYSSETPPEKLYAEITVPYTRYILEGSTLKVFRQAPWWRARSHDPQSGSHPSCG